jgi:hypothetical protein
MRTSQVNAAKLESEKIVLAAPLSYAGSAARIWRLTGLTANAWGRIGLGIAAILLIAWAWIFVTGWYLLWDSGSCRIALSAEAVASASAKRSSTGRCWPQSSPVTTDDR